MKRKPSCKGQGFQGHRDKGEIFILRFDPGGLFRIGLLHWSPPLVPPIEGMERVTYLTSTEAIEINGVPPSMIVLGANAVGLEFSQMFSRLGSKVTLHEVVGRIAPQEEPEISEALENYLKEEGIEIYTCSKTIQVREERGKKVITSKMQSGKTQDFWVEALLIATGRRPNSKASD